MRGASNLSQSQPTNERPVSYTVDLVIFACLNFRKFVIFGLFVKSTIRKLSILIIVALL